MPFENSEPLGENSSIILMYFLPILSMFSRVHCINITECVFHHNTYSLNTCLGLLNRHVSWPTTISQALTCFLAFMTWLGCLFSSALVPWPLPHPSSKPPRMLPINQSHVWMLSLWYQACSLETASLGRLIFSSPLLWSPPRCHTIACGEQDVFLSSFLSFPLYRHLRSKVMRKRRILWRPLPDSTLSFKMDIQVFKTHYLKKYIF